MFEGRIPLLIMEEKDVQPLLTPRQVAKVLSTSERKVGDLLRSGQLVGVKVGREWRVDKVDLDEYIKRNKTRASL